MSWRVLSLQMVQRMSSSVSLPKAASYATQAVEFKKQTKGNLEKELQHAKPYAQLPGPSKYKFLLGFLLGGFNQRPFMELLQEFNEQYGQIFRIPGLFGKSDIIMSMNPADYELIFRNEGQYPYRRSFDSFTYYREVHNPEMFEDVGTLTSSNGELWAKTRSAVNPILLQPKNAKLYLNTLVEVNNEFLLRVHEARDVVNKEMPENFEDDIRRLVMESVGSVVLNTKLGFLRKNRNSAETHTILHAMRRFSELSFEIDIAPSIWKIIKTPKFRELLSVLDILTDTCDKYIQEALVRIEHNQYGELTSAVGQEKSVLEKLVRVNRKMAVVIALDMLIAGVDPTTTSLTGVLLGLAKNPDKQQKLYNELVKVLPGKNSTFSMENMRNLPYLRACIKEGIRLCPIGPGTMRRMPHDIVLSGYRIPAGTDVTMGANLQMTSESFVPRAKEFLPERWLRNADDNSNPLIGNIASPFMYIPFGFGPRSCAGKRIVEIFMEVTIARLVRNFEIEFNYPVENAFKAKFFSVPNIPLKFKFADRLA